MNVTIERVKHPDRDIVCPECASSKAPIRKQITALGTKCWECGASVCQEHGTKNPPYWRYATGIEALKEAVNADEESST